MKNLFLKASPLLTMLVVIYNSFFLPVSAALPVTGDERGQRLWIVIVILVVAVVAIVAVGISMSRKKK